MNQKLKAKVKGLHEAELERWRTSWIKHLSGPQKLAVDELQNVGEGWSVVQRWRVGRRLVECLDELMRAADEEMKGKVTDGAGVFDAVDVAHEQELIRMRSEMSDADWEAWYEFVAEYYIFLETVDLDHPDLSRWPSDLPTPPVDPTPYLHDRLERFAAAEEDSADASRLAWLASEAATFVQLKRV